MRQLFVMLLAGLLAACGGEEDFNTSFDRPQADVLAALGKIDARPQIGFITAASSITHSRPSNDTIAFTILSPDGSEQAQYAFRVEAVEAGKSVVHTTIDVPAVKLKVGKEDMYVSEWKLTVAVRKAMKALTRSMKSGSSGTREVAAIGELIGLTGVLLDPSKVQEAELLASDMTAASEEWAKQAQWNEDNQGDWASTDSAMDDADGSEIAANDISSSDVEGSAASGYDPEGSDPSDDDDFDSDFGEPSGDW